MPAPRGPCQQTPVLEGRARLPYARAGDVIPRAAIKDAPTCLRCAAAPLFEEKRDVLVGAAVAQFANPFGAHRTVVVARLAAGDQPVDAGEVKSVERPQQRFRRDEPDRGRYLAKVVDAVNEPPVLNRYAHPDVVRPGQTARDVGEPAGTLGKDLEGVLW